MKITIEHADIEQAVMTDVGNKFPDYDIALGDFSRSKKGELSVEAELTEPKATGTGSGGARSSSKATSES